MIRKSFSSLSRRVLYSSRSFSSPASGQEQETTHFGFQEIPKQEKEKKVAGVFHQVANKYDLMNDAMSLGIHRYWKEYFVGCVMKPQPGWKLLDVAGGTGDIAFRFMEHATMKNKPAAFSHLYKSEQPEQQQTCAVVCDINSSMLKVGEERARQRGYTIVSHLHKENPNIKDKRVVYPQRSYLEFIEGNAECLPGCLPIVEERAPGDFQPPKLSDVPSPIQSNTFDCYTIAFGLRNVTTPFNALKEAYRVLKPGGRFLCLEFSHIENPILRQLYDQYSFYWIPLLGEVLVNDRGSYQYLVESIRKFPKQQELAAMMREAGFKNVTYENLQGGLVAIHSGFKL